MSAVVATSGGHAAQAGRPPVRCVEDGAVSAELANPDGVDVLLEGNSFATVHVTRMSIGLGDDAPATARSLSTASRRAVRADRLEAASAR